MSNFLSGFNKIFAPKSFVPETDRHVLKKQKKIVLGGIFFAPLKNISSLNLEIIFIQCVIYISVKKNDDEL